MRLALPDLKSGVSRLLPLACLVPALVAGCSRGGTHPLPSNRENGVDAAFAAVDAAAEGSQALGVFSAPIGAARVGGVDVVAGLVAAEGIVRAIGLVGGAVVWSSDALRGVAWSPDAELRLQPAIDGVAVSWRGLHDGKVSRTVVLLGPRGEPRGAPVEIGGTFCGTADGLAWVGPQVAGRTRVRARRWAQPDVRDVVSLPPDSDPTLVCGDHDVVVLGDRDDDLTASAFTPGDAAARTSVVAMRNADFADEEREHDAYSIGDDLGLVRVGTSGAVALREVPRVGPPGAWRRLKHAVSADDDVVTVDGDPAATFIVVAHDAGDACSEGGAAADAVRAIRVDRTSGEESILELAPADCERARGPFWIAATPLGPLVAWVERRTAQSVKAAPIAGLAFRVLRADGSTVGRVGQAADALADCGCDQSGCAVAALVREPGSDGMKPAPIRVFAYP